jgi:hypothetical protein
MGWFIIIILGCILVSLLCYHDIDIIVTDVIPRVRAIYKARDQDGPDDCDDPRAGCDRLTKLDYRGERRVWQEDHALNVLMANLGPYPPMIGTSVFTANYYHHYDREPFTRFCCCITMLLL